MSTYVLSTVVAAVVALGALAAALVRGRVAIGRPRRAARTVLAAAVLMLLAAIAIKVPFLAVGWGTGARYGAFTPVSYSDLSTLYLQRGFAEDRIPYVEAENEYPVLGGAVMWLAAALTTGARGFHLVVVGVMLACGVATAVILERLVGRRALIFALAPIVVLEAFVNVDLLAVLLATGALAAFLRGRDGLAGTLVGLGVAAKLYPVLLLPVFVVDRFRRGGGDPRAAVPLVASAAAAWLVVNVPFAVASYQGWAEFFRFSADRQPVGGSSWSILCREVACFSIPTINAASLALFLFAALVVWGEKTNRHPDTPRWTLIFPLVALFLVTNKIYSPQYSLWMLPLFALVLPDLRLVTAFVAADVAVYLSEMSTNFEDLLLPHPMPLGLHSAAVALRGLVLVVCVVRYVGTPFARAPDALAQGPDRSGAAVAPS